MLATIKGCAIYAKGCCHSHGKLGGEAATLTEGSSEVIHWEGDQISLRAYEVEAEVVRLEIRLEAGVVQRLVQRLGLNVSEHPVPGRQFSTTSR